LRRRKKRSKTGTAQDFIKNKTIHMNLKLVCVKEAGAGGLLVKGSAALGALYF
jgi:hypothetical protein